MASSSKRFIGTDDLQFTQEFLAEMLGVKRTSVTLHARKRSLFHFKPTEIAEVLDSFLQDEVRFMQDGFLDVDAHGTQKVFAIRS